MLLGLKYLFFILVVLFSVSLNAQVLGVNYQWKQTLNKNGIQVFSSRVPDSAYRASRAQMTINGEVTSLVAMLEDIDNCSNWASLCKEVSVVQEVSNAESFIYILNAVTFPLADRELIAHIKWKREPQSGKVTMNSQAVDFPSVPIKPSTIRLRKALTQWHFTPQKNGKVLVESYAHIDPNGVIPAWVINMLSKRAPYRSMMKIKALIESGEYDGRETIFAAHSAY